MRGPKRGEVWLVDLGFAAKTRPCLVISIPAEDEDRALITLIPHTTSVRSSRFEVVLSTKYLRIGAFDAQSIVTVPRAKAIRRLGELTTDQLAEIEDVICLWLGL